MRRVIGLGSPHGDDRIGWQLIDELARLRLPPDVELRALDRPGVALLAELDGAERVWLLDACDMGAAPGTLRRWTRQALPLAGAAASLSCHDIGLAEALQLADACGLALPPLILVAIQPAQMAPLAPLSPPVQGAIPACLELLLSELTSG